MCYACNPELVTKLPVRSVSFSIIAVFSIAYVLVLLLPTAIICVVVQPLILAVTQRSSSKFKFIHIMLHLG